MSPKRYGLSGGDWFVLAIIAILVVSFVKKQEPVVDAKIDRITYVYEKDDTVIPAPVSYALRQINDGDSGIIASEFEKDTVNGVGEVPEQYVIALKAAKERGLPALVVQAGEKVVRVVRDPKTEDDVMGVLE